MSISPYRYLRIFFIGTFAILASTIFLNYFEDPFGIYHDGKAWDWIKNRPFMDSFQAMHKAYAVEKANADILFLGDSRVVNGLDPHSVPGNAFNLATYGSGVYQNLRYLQHALSYHRPSVVVMGIDLRFFWPQSLATDDFMEDRMSVQANGRPTPYRAFVDWGATLLSWKALRASLGTLLATHRSPVINYDRGYEPEAGELSEGFNLTSRVAAFNASASSWSAPSYLDQTGKSHAMGCFRDMARLCAANHIKLIVFVLPAHAFTLDLNTSNWQVYSSWMHEVLDVMEKEPSLQQEFWDFTGYNRISTERFTPTTERYSRTVFYWEYSHFKKSVGDLVLKRIFIGEGPPFFGRRVTLATLPQDLRRLREEKENWHTRHHLAPLEITLHP